ncbi:hypothetical protein ACW5CM_15110 [Microbacterium sp. A588]
MIDKRLLFGNISTAFIAQAIVLLSSLFAALVLPKVLGVSEFGYWQLFALYAAYSGLLHLGLNDGVYLIYGGQTRKTVDRAAVTSQFVVSIFIQVVLTGTLTGIAFALNLSDERRFVLAMFAIYTLLYNLTAFLGFMFQALNETKAYSLAMALSRLVFLSFVVAAVVAQATTFQWVIVFFIIGQAAALGFALFYARGALFGGPIRIRTGLRDALDSIRVGWWLTVANLSSLLLLGAVRFIVDARWDIETFATISLLVLLVTFVLQFVSQISMVLFPALRQIPRADAVAIFARVNQFLAKFSPIIYVLYFPAYLAVYWWLPDYRDGLVFLGLIFPLAVINANLDLGYSTFMKVLRQERVMFAINIASLTAMVAVSCVMAFVFGSIWGVLITQYVVVLLRWCATDWLLRRRLLVPQSRFMLSNVVLSIAFVVVVSLCTYFQGLVVWLAILGAYLVSSALIARRRAAASHITDRDAA